MVVRSGVASVAGDVVPAVGENSQFAQLLRRVIVQLRYHFPHPAEAKVRQLPDVGVVALEKKKIALVDGVLRDGRGDALALALMGFPVEQFRLEASIQGRGIRQLRLGYGNGETA